MRATSTPFKRAAYRSQTDEAILLLLEISHPELAAPIRITSDALATPHGAAFAATFTRASTAVKTDGSAEVAVGIPRYGSGVYGQALMVEEGTTNLLPNSEQLNLSPWLKGRTTIVTNAALAPNGTMTAEKLVETTETGPHHLNQTYAFVAGSSYTLSVFVKAAERTKGRIQLGNGAVAFSGGTAYCEYNLVTKTATKGTYGTAAGIQEVADGWFRVWITGTAGSSATDVAFLAYLLNGAAVSYTGTLGSGLYLWGGQLEEKNYLTSYHPTTAIAATRANEGLTIPTAGILASSEGTIQGLFTSDLDRSDINALFDTRSAGFSDTNTNMFRAYLNLNNQLVVTYGTGTGAVSTLPHPTILTPGQPFRAGVVWSSAGVLPYVNGIPGTINAEPLAISVGPLLRIGTDNSARPLNGLIDGFCVSRRPYTAAEMLAGVGARLRIDADTTAWLGFDGTLNSAYCYLACPFTITLPDDRDDQITTARVAIDNVDRAIVQAIRQISSPPTVSLSIVLASTPDVIEAGPIPFTLTGASWDALTVEGSLGFADELLGQGYPSHAMTPQLFPGIFA